MERLWLTPGFRIFMRYGLPVLVVLALAGGYLASDSRRAALAGQFTALRDRIENRPEFMVKMMSIDGASAPVADAIRAMVPAELPVSSFKLDLDGFRDTIAGMDAVADVSVKLKAGGVLGVTVTERKPAILWRTETGLEMLDATGHRVATLLERGARPDLPVVAGAGAPDAVPEALAILAAARPILPHVRGMVRMGGRRWDIVLDRGQRILLPEDHAVEAVEEVIALDKAEDLLARDLTAIDLRNSERPTLRLTAAAEAVLRGATQTEAKVTGQ
ncbi:MAG: cell division protein FtsQ/DivIB [Proteobacteria bacterium]|nr:cell division protein FtsQ/DivIB [Pseudomonadota bacterium]MBS0574320.1 cell division protein FtsQ/DivIB [Pseudomonadota bacterium]